MVMIKIKECLLFKKICTKCKDIKSIKCFRKDKHSKTGYTCRCKYCIDNKYKNICEYCNKEFMGSHPNQRYCSISCSNTIKNKERIIYDIEDEIKTNNYDIKIVDGQNIQCLCDMCGKSIIRQFSKFKLTKYHYCSSKCKHNHTDIYSGENSATWKGGLIAINCSLCGKEFKMKRDKLDKFENHYCSTECMGKHREIIYVGENSPTWNPNLTEDDRVRANVDYCEWRMRVYKRDDYTCQCCGKHGGDINAHHLDGFSWAKDKRTDVNNGITLCEKCHKDFHFKYGYGDNTKEQYIEYKNMFKKLKAW